MTKEAAIAEATEIANRDRIVMVVTVNPYEETENDEEKYNFFPRGVLDRMHRIGAFKYDEVVETIKPEAIS